MNKLDTTQEVITFAAPVLDESQMPTSVPWQSDLPQPPRNQFEREYQTFLKLRPSLLATHRGKCVAIYQGNVVDSGDDDIELALRVYAKYGYVPIFISRVTAMRRVERIRLPRNATTPNNS